jgi:hypothetical protein
VWPLRELLLPEEVPFLYIVYFVQKARNRVLEKIYDERRHEKTSVAALRSATLQAN